MPKRDLGEEHDTITQDKIETVEPSMYRVILLNDDYTTMEFVVLVLENVFHMPPPKAQEVMFSVHTSGRGIAGVYTKEIAETKIAITHQLARHNEFPLKCIMEPA